MKNFSHRRALTGRGLFKLGESIRFCSFLGAKLTIPSLKRGVICEDLLIKESLYTERLLITNLETIKFELVRGELVV